jgi:hypothetical protein
VCRLCLASFTNAPPGVKADIVHEILMRAANGDGGQRDGYGVSDMHGTVHSANWYYECIPTWKKQLDDSAWIMAHLRKASAGTQRTINEAHPYTFKTKFGTLHAAHNGYFAGTKYLNWSSGQPGTDSFRALSDLARLIDQQESNIITADLVNEWLSLYADDSHYAVMLHLGAHSYVLRGKTRPMAALRVGNGYIFHTDYAVLRQMEQYIPAMHDLEVPDRTITLGDNMLVRVSLGRDKVILSELHPQHTKPTYGTTTWHTDPKQSAATAVNQNVDDTRRGAGSYIVADTVTPPRPQKGLPVPAPTALAALVRSTQNNIRESTLSERRSLWTAIVGKLSPMRRELALLWVSSILGYTAEDEESPLLRNFLQHATVTEFAAVETVLFPINAEGKWTKPFTPIAHMQLNWWNHVVKDGTDAALHIKLLGNNWFWLDPLFVRIRSEDSKEQYAAFLAWQSYMLQMFSNMTKAEKHRFLDVEKLQRMVTDTEQVHIEVL